MSLDATPVIDRPDRIPRDPQEFVRNLTTRNSHFVTPEAQERILGLKILVAGCGSAGGACTEPLARLGATRFRLADNGAYELSNLNRQRAYPEDLGVNKAEFQMRQLKKLNPHVDVQAFPEGLTPVNVRGLVQWADVVIDGVDVTTADGMRMKLALHESAHAEKKPVFCMLDVGFCQWGRSYDYRTGIIAPLGGKLEAARKAKHPLAALFAMFPLSSVPDHCLPLVEELLTDGTRPASQLACAADLLSATMAAALVRFAETGEVARGWNINLDTIALPLRKRLALKLSGVFSRRRIRARIRKLS